MADDDKPKDDDKVVDDKPKDDKPADDKPKTEEFTIKIDGVDRTVTRDELIEMASKSGGADEKFREAAQMREDAQRGAKIGGLFEKLTDGTTTKKDMSELAGLIGLNPADVEKMMNEEDPKSKGKDEKPAGESKPMVLEDMPDDVQKAVVASKKAEYDKAIEIIKENCKKVVDKDEIIAKLIGDSKEADAKLAVVSGMVFDDVQRRILSGEQYGPEMVASSTQKMRTQLKDFGIPSKASEQPNLPLMMGFTQPSVLPAEVQADEPIKRVELEKVTDSEYAENFYNRFLQQRVKAVKS